MQLHDYTWMVIFRIRSCFNNITNGYTAVEHGELVFVDINLQDSMHLWLLAVDFNYRIFLLQLEYSCLFCLRSTKISISHVGNGCDKKEALLHRKGDSDENKTNEIHVSSKVGSWPLFLMKHGAFR